jgi:CHAT domain-containing protein
MLVRKAPPLIQQISDYRNVDWVAKHYAISVLPSVSSIHALRSFPQNSTRQNPFIGFGDPVIGEQLNSTRSHKAKLGYEDIFRSLIANTTSRNVVSGKMAEIADVNSIRNAPSLPETSDELLKIAKALNADSSSVWLRQNATETNVKKLDLSTFRTLAFATHGVMAGELKGVGEPGLILTPPKQGTLEDDGYLSSSEIAKLKLNADWVILSACNTAASDGTTGAEGLSGIAKAFFYAGARSLLVSHWPVMSEATVPLTTYMINEYAKNPTLGKAQAQRKAMLSLMNSNENPEYAHPVFWAPFVVVGEGS